MAFLPPIVWKKDGDEIQQLRNYVMQLEEQLRYVLNNLGAENLTDGAIGENALAPSVKTEILESKNSAQKNSLAIKKSTKELLIKVQQVADNTYEKQTSFDINADGVEVKSTGSFTVEAGAGFSLHSQNLDCDENGLIVKSGTLQGEHLTTDGERLLSAKDIVVATTAPSGYNDRIWVKPLDSVSVTYARSISSRVQLIGWSGTIETSGANSAAAGIYSYKLKIPYHVDTSSGSGADITVTVGGSLVFTTHINPGHYSGPSTYVADGVAEINLSSAVWLGENNSLSISISGSAPGNTSKYKLNIGQITLQATSAGNSGAGWKACEIKVYQE